MKLYIPEIGDKIVLKKDWTFNLHAENRNKSLLELFGYGLMRGGIYKLSEVIDPGPAPKIEYPSPEDFTKTGFFKPSVDYDAYNKACNEAVASNIEYQTWLQKYNTYLSEIDKIKIDYIQVTLPQGTELTVDRIYIRKGLKDFSSITFFASGLGESTKKVGWGSSARTQKVKKQRFWVKLSDCNKIEFEGLAS